MRRLLLVLVVALLVMPGVSLLRADAKDAPGCDGLGEYRAELFAVGSDYYSALADGFIDVTAASETYSTDDWSVIADASLQLQRDLKAIDPPEWIREWHVKQITQVGGLQQVASTAVESGVFAASMVGSSFAELPGQIKQIQIDLEAVCADAKQFFYDWAALDGYVAGTPVATPSF
jgi:hypothetical protein